jgi:hypothetical protein
MVRHSHGKRVKHAGRHYADYPGQAGAARSCKQTRRSFFRTANLHLPAAPLVNLRVMVFVAEHSLIGLSIVRHAQGVAELQGRAAERGHASWDHLQKP